MKIIGSNNNNNNNDDNDNDNDNNDNNSNLQILRRSFPISDFKKGFFGRATMVNHHH